MSLQKRCSLTDGVHPPAQKRARAKPAVQRHSKHSTFFTLDTNSRLQYHKVYFHACCCSFGYGSTDKKYGHRETEVIDWSAWTEQNGIKSQTDLEGWLFYASIPLQAFLPSSAGQVHVYCDERRRELMKLSPTQLVDLVLELEQQKSQGSLGTAAEESQLQLGPQQPRLR